MSHSFACSVVVFALFAIDLGACGSSPHSVATPLASLRGSSTAAISVNANEVSVSIGGGNDSDACPELHASATVNGRAMNLEDPGGYSAGSGDDANGCDENPDGAYQPPGCEPAVFVADTNGEDMLTFVVTDESDTFHIVGSGFFPQISASLLTPLALIPGETTRISLTPPLAANDTVDIDLEPDHQFSVSTWDAQIDGNAVSFIVPPPEFYDDAGADGGDASTCMMQHHDACPETLVVTTDRGSPDAVSTCDGPSTCSAGGISGMAPISVDVTYAP